MSLISVRLVGGLQASEGRVEIRHEGVWGTVCDDHWDNVDASVVCRQLGYETGLAVAKHDFGEGWDYPILLDSVACQGPENSLEECGHEPWGQHDCSHREDAGVACCKCGLTLNISAIVSLYRIIFAMTSSMLFPFGILPTITNWYELTLISHCGILAKIHMKSPIALITNV